MEDLFQLNEVISVVCCSDVHEEFGQKPGSAPAAGLLHTLLLREEEKTMRGWW